MQHRIQSVVARQQCNLTLLGLEMEINCHDGFEGYNTESVDSPLQSGYTITDRIRCNSPPSNPNASAATWKMVEISSNSIVCCILRHVVDFPYWMGDGECHGGVTRTRRRVDLILLSLSTPIKSTLPHVAVISAMAFSNHTTVGVL